MSNLHGIHCCILPIIPCKYVGADLYPSPVLLCYGDSWDYQIHVPEGTSGRLYDILKTWGEALYLVINFDGIFGSVYVHEKYFDRIKLDDPKDEERLRRFLRKKHEMV